MLRRRQIQCVSRYFYYIPKHHTPSPSGYTIYVYTKSAPVISFTIKLWRFLFKQKWLCPNTLESSRTQWNLYRIQPQLYELFQGPDGTFTIYTCSMLSGIQQGWKDSLVKTANTRWYMPNLIIWKAEVGRPRVPGMSNLYPSGHMRPRIAINEAQHNIVSLKIL